MIEEEKMNVDAQLLESVQRALEQDGLLQVCRKKSEKTLDDVEINSNLGCVSCSP